jgi:1L-myo-inositol 1-phosphate cytidylyltransferase / CDP-L-myo-inositol myo-inositolphosphotransferase
MTNISNPPQADTIERNLSGVLFLKKPDRTENPVDWYSSKIAGVPFALRNLLTLQRVNIKNLAVFMDDPENDLERLFKTILKDSRISANVVWIGNNLHLKEWILNNPNQVYIFNGSALHDKKLLNEAINLHPHKENELQTNFSVNPDNLEEFFIKIQNEPTISDSNKLLKKLHTGFPIYIQGTEGSEIKEPDDFKILHEKQVEGSGLNHDSPITRIFSRPASRVLTRIFLNTPISPNQITLISFFLGLASAYFFFQGFYQTSVIAATLLVFSTWVDGADGEIARLKFMESDIGKKLDIYGDNIVHFLVFTAIGIGIYNKTGETIYLYIGGLAGLGGLLAFFLLSPILLKKRSPAKQLFHVNEPDLAEKFANRDFIHFLFLVSLIDQLEIFILIAAVGANIFAGFLVYSRFLKLKTA